MSKVIAVYAGTFDPVTNGHINIIERASLMFDELYVVIGINPNKKTWFSLEERIAFLKEATKHLEHVKIDATNQLIVDYAKEKKAKVLVRGLRTNQDFDYEMNLAYANHYLEKEIDTIFLPTYPELSFVSSSTIKEMASYHRDVSDLVPSCVNEAIIERNKADL